MLALVLAGWVTAGLPQYRAEIVVAEGKSVAFELAFPHGIGNSDHVLIRNGAEVIRAPLARRTIAGSEWAGELQTIEFPHYDSYIVFQLNQGILWGGMPPLGSIPLVGQWHLTRRDGHVAKLQFRAAPGESSVPRYPRASAAESPPLAKTWRMDFEQSGPARGECDTVKDEVRCTVLTPTGDYRYLAGTLDGDRLRLSVFDGAHAFLFDAKLAADGSKLTGTFFSGAHWRETFTAVPADDVALPDGFGETKLVGEKLTLAALDDPRFAGKPVLVEVFGTWCPNCHDAAALLAALQKKHPGVALLGVAFEHTDDAARSRRQVDRFTARHGLDWKVVVAGTSKKADASKALPQLDRVRAYPTTLFVNRDRTVRAIHTGFSGPATGAVHVKLKAEFERLTREILASE